MKKVFTKALLLAGMASSLPIGMSTQAFAATNPQGAVAIQTQADQNSSNVLSIGNQGPEVVTLQNKLHSLGYTIAPDTNGYFGSQTQKAVESYQQSNHLTLNGIVDVATWKCLLNQVPGNMSAPSLGSQGEDVALTQDKLRALGYTIAPDSYGDFGEQTQRAVESYQKSNHLMISGIVDPTTWQYLSEQVPNSKSPTLSLGSKGNDVTTLQNKLHSLGYTIAPDTLGNFGEQTQHAVESYQESNHVTSNGVVDATTWKYLLTQTGGSAPTLSTQPTLSSPSESSTKEIAYQQIEQPVEEKRLKNIAIDYQIINNSSTSSSGSNSSNQTHRKEASPSSRSVTSSHSSVVSIAEQYIGDPYVYGGTSPAGFDCSGFVQFVFNRVGISLPHSSAAMYNMGTNISTCEPGDLVFFNTSGAGVSHVGIYVGNNEFISATCDGVEIASLSNSYWGPRFIGAKHL